MEKPAVARQSSCARAANRMLRIIRHFFGGGGDDIGAQAECSAGEWLRRNRKFEIVARNWRNPLDRRQELDLVCRDREVLVFVEVKARAAGAKVAGYFAVDRRKKRVILRAAKAYLARLNPRARAFRFDVVEVTLGADGVNAGSDGAILHFENVPLFPKHFRG
jgi:putative endonuclease